MASRKTLNVENLEALGVRRLAELLVDIAEGDAATKRRLRLELTAQRAPETMALEVRKRLIQMARARSFVDWRKIRDLVADLEAQRRAIVDQVAKSNAAEAKGEAIQEVAASERRGRVTHVIHDSVREGSNSNRSNLKVSASAGGGVFSLDP